MPDFERSTQAPSVSLYDVAERAGVSHQTVSNALNHPERVRPATRERVERAVIELGYHPVAAARSLGSGRSDVIGLQLPRRAHGSTSAFFEHFTLELADAARAQGRHVLIFSSDEQGSVEAIRLHRSRQIAGTILVDTRLNDPRPLALQAAQVPFVAFGRSRDHDDYPWVDVDNYRAMRLLLDHLMERGHSRITYVHGASKTFYENERVRGLKEVLRHQGPPLGPEAILSVDLDADSAKRQVRQRLQDASPPTAIIASSDLLAAVVMDAARDLRREIGPGGLAVAAFDDTPLSTLLSPSLTTIDQPIAVATRLLVEHLIHGGPPGAPRHDLLEPRLVVRESS